MSRAYIGLFCCRIHTHGVFFAQIIPSHILTAFDLHLSVKWERIFVCSFVAAWFEYMCARSALTVPRRELSGTARGRPRALCNVGQAASFSFIAHCQRPPDVLTTQTRRTSRSAKAKKNASSVAFDSLDVAHCCTFGINKHRLISSYC